MTIFKSLRSPPILFILLLAIGGGWVYFTRLRVTARTVLSEPLRRGSIVESAYGIGTVMATNTFQLKPGVTSTLLELMVREGDSVEKNQRLANLDGMGYVTAPFAGTITSLPTKVGETVFPQSIILVLTDLVDRYLLVSLEQRAALRVREGQRATISFDSMRGEAYEGIVQSVYSNENDFLVRIGISELPPSVLPGMTGDVAIAIAQHDRVLLLPVAAIDQGTVKVHMAPGRTKKVEVRTGIVDGAMAECLSAELKEGDRLVLSERAAP